MEKKRTDLKIPYGIMDFRRLRREGYYYVDKTEYLAQMEARDSFIFFVRPRRFGQSLFISMMESYYDLNQKKDFKKLFGDLWIGRHPTENANRFMTLKLDFSKVGGTGEALEVAFESHIGKQLDDMVLRYPACFDAEFRALFLGQPASDKLADVVNTVRYYGDVPHSYIVEFKYVKKGAKKAELDAQRKEGVAQLKMYAKDRKIPALAKGTTLHLILVQYRGPKMCTCELVGEKQY